MVSKKVHGRGGFTFIEIMFVVVIIGILASIVAVNTGNQTIKARVMTTRANMSSIKSALQMYEMNVGQYPTTEQGLAALIRCPQGVDENLWGNSCYLQDGVIPRDGWKREFVYIQPGEHISDYDLYSKGPDGEEHTEDDIHNWPDSDEIDG